MVVLPLATRFRGIDRREALLLEGPEGWSEFSPFTEYEDAEASTWLAAAIADGWHPRPTALRDRIGVNATLPAVPAGPGRIRSRPIRRDAHGQGQGRRGRPDAGG